MSYSAALIARFLVTAFFAVVFLQSGIDKIVDRDGNLGFFKSHFANSPFPAELVPWLLTALCGLEIFAGGMCTLGIISGSWARGGFGVAAFGVAVSGVALLALFLGQRLAKDYEGAAVITAYFAVALLGLNAF